MPTAIITGSTGILGRSILQTLTSDPQWSTIHALSHRSPPDSESKKVHHSKIDLLAAPETLAMQLKGAEVRIQAEYLFFCAYLQRGDEGELERVNGDMLRNLLTALAFTGAERTLKRVVLTTGAKHYGVHLGPVKCPMEETDPWVEGAGRPPNFYYRQQRILKEMSETSVAKGGGGWDWVVTYPNDVLGVVSGNFMNLVTALGVYAVICKELQEPFVFPGSRDFYTRFDSFTDSKLHARFCRWAALEPGCKNQAFNVVDGDVQSWQTLWPKLADRFGLAVPADQFKGQDEKVVPLIERPPVMEQKESIGLGEVKRGEVRMRIDLLAWADRDDVKKAWERVADREGLRRQVLGEATWFFLNFVLGRNYDVVISMSKARKLGFREEVDSWDALDECLGELEETDVLPKRR